MTPTTFVLQIIEQLVDGQSLTPEDIRQIEQLDPLERQFAHDALHLRCQIEGIRLTCGEHRP